MKRRSIRALGLSVAVAASLSACPLAYAAEGVVLAGPVGGSDLGAAILPPAGLYGAMGYAYAAGTQLTDGNGSGIPGYDLQAHSAIAAFLYVYDTEIFGGRIASSIAELIPASFCLKVSTAKGCTAGPADPYLDMFEWSRFFPSEAFASQPKGTPPIPFGWTFAVGLGLSVPVGSYSATAFVSSAPHIWDIAPNIALTYTRPGIIGDATEISTRIYWNQYLKNTATGYTSGPILDVNFAISERFNAWQFGVAGDYHVQVSDDISALGQRVLPDGKRNQEVKLGPIIAYDFHMADRLWQLKGKVLFDIDGKNAAGYDLLIVSLATKLF